MIFGSVVVLDFLVPGNDEGGIECGDFVQS